MEIDFGKVVKLSSFYINHWSYRYGATGLRLETSADGNKWTDWGEVSCANMGTYYVNLSTTEEIQYMRIVFTGAVTSSVEVDGMAFYGE